MKISDAFHNKLFPAVHGFTESRLSDSQIRFVFVEYGDPRNPGYIACTEAVPLIWRLRFWIHWMGLCIKWDVITYYQQIRRLKMELPSCAQNF